MEKRYQDPQKRASRWQELESKIFVENFQKKSYLVSLQRWNPNQRLPIFAEVNFVSKFPGEKKVQILGRLIPVMDIRYQYPQKKHHVDKNINKRSPSFPAKVESNSTSSSFCWGQLCQFVSRHHFRSLHNTNCLPINMFRFYHITVHSASDSMIWIWCCHLITNHWLAPAGRLYVTMCHDRSISWHPLFTFSLSSLDAL